MPREIPPPTIQNTFLLSALQDGQRLDGRALLDMRNVELTFGEELGEVWCKLGKTSVMAQIQATIVKPRDDRPYEGFLIIHSEIGSMASGVYENGRSSEEEVLITRLLEKAIRRTEAIDREALCIIAGQKVWQIRLTLHFLSDEGNLLDCACIAGMTALKHFRKGEVEVTGDGELIVHSADDRSPIPLSIHHTPFCLTFAYFQDNLLVLDPSHLESQLSTGLLTLTLNAQRELCVLSKAGGTPLDVDEIMRVIKVGVVKVRELGEFVERRLEEDWKTRVVEVE